MFFRVMGGVYGGGEFLGNGVINVIDLYVFNISSPCLNSAI